MLPYGIARYAVSRVIIVYPDRWRKWPNWEGAGVAGCLPPLYSAKQRIVVQGELISFKLIEPRG